VELVNQLPDLQLRWYAWWITDTVKTIAEKYGLDPQHANWLEAFDFTIVSDLPVEIKPCPQVGEYILGKVSTHKTYGDGSFGGRYQVESAIMKELFNACLADVQALLDFN
jgi:creatinine amidohydrolase